MLNICLLSTVYWKDKNKEKEAGYGPFKKTIMAHIKLLFSGDLSVCLPIGNYQAEPKSKDK